MIKSKYLFLLILSIATLFVACEDDTPEPEQISILGEWTFVDSEIETITIDEEIGEFTAPDVTGIKWTFQEENDLLVDGADTVYTTYYNYDELNKQLEVEGGFYDVTKHTQDSLVIKYYVDISLLGEFNIYLFLMR
ncbi:MAG: hypothetical protein NXI20_02045 [bacterium]|nr:hypothetical protein [bacterium]